MCYLGAGVVPEARKRRGVSIRAIAQTHGLTNIRKTYSLIVETGQFGQN